MAYNVELADRIRALLDNEPDLSVRAMFGGLGFMIGGNMAVAASSKGGVILRIDPAHTAELAQREGLEVMVMRGRAMNGWLHVAAGQVEGADDLERLVALGADYARSLPPK